MRIAGNYTFEATRDEVWSALNDPEVLARTIPGCQHLNEVGDHEYESTLKVSLQAVRGTYSGRVKINNIVAPESYEIHVDGKGSNGFLKGAGMIKLRTDGAQTILDYGGEAQVGGTIASVGQRLLDGAAKSLINQSLKALAQQIADRRLHLSAHTAEVLHAVVEELASTAAPLAEELPPATVEAVPPPLRPAIERRTITISAGQGLSETAVAQGMLEDFFRSRPWLPWMLVAFLLGYLLGRRN